MKTKLNLLKPYGDDLDLLGGRKEVAQNRIEELNAEFEESREEELPLVHEVDSKVKELQQTINELNKHQMKLKTEINKVKEKTKEMDDKISEQILQENANLCSKIVQSPDKLQLQRTLEEKKLVQAETKKR